MVPPIKAIDSQRMRCNFSSQADLYDRYASVQKRVVELLSRQIDQIDFPSGLCLDVGTGTGGLAAEMITRVSERNMFLMDIAHGMTKAASKNMAAAFACDGDAHSLPFANEVFSCVVSSSVYQWVNCLPLAFAEVFRVLKPGGCFAIALFGEKTLYELRDSHQRAVACDGNRRASHVQSFPKLSEVGDAIVSAGFVCNELHTSLEIEYHLDVPDLLKQLKQIGAGNASKERPVGLAPRSIILSMIKFYEEMYRCDDGLPASYEVIVAIARKS